VPRSVLVYAFRRPNRQASVPAYIGARKIHDAIEKYSSRTSCTIPFLRPVVFPLPIVLPFFMALDIKNKFHRYRRPQSSRRRAEHQLRAASQARAAIPRVPYSRQSAALARNPGTSNFRSNFADNKPLPLPFLIANPRLEIELTHSKESLLKISNREEIAFFPVNSLLDPIPSQSSSRLRRNPVPEIVPEFISKHDSPPLASTIFHFTV
jgi:hypothetical protein